MSCRWRNNTSTWSRTLSRQPVYLWRRRVRFASMEVWRRLGLWRWLWWRRMSYVTQ